MELINESLPGLLELKMVVHEDNRGSFCEAFNGRTMAGFGIEETFTHLKLPQGETATTS